MEIRVDRYTKMALTVIALGLIANLFVKEDTVINNPIAPEAAHADNIILGSPLSGKGHRVVTSSPDGKTLYLWFIEEDSQWYDRDKIRFVAEEQVEK